MRLRTLGLAGASLAGAMVPLSAAADDGVARLEEIIVTAEKRAEDLQQVPLSLQVVTESALKEHEVKSFDDYAKLLTSLSYSSLGPGQAQLFFRGIATDGEGLHAGALPSTSVYVDEIPVTTIGNALDIHMYDMARVEALAGPQGTLYGASSLSGTLRIITNKPDPSGFLAGYDLRLNKPGSGDLGGGFEGFLNVPLNSAAAIRLVGYYDHAGGYINNIYRSDTLNLGVPDAGIPNTPKTYDNARAVRRHSNPVDTYGGRAALKIELGDSWTISPQLLAQGQHADGDFNYDPLRGDLNVADYLIGLNRDRWYQAALTVEGKISNFDVVYAGGWFERKVDNLVDYSAYTIAYDLAAQLPGATSNYARFIDSTGNLIDNPFQYYVDRDSYTKMTHELRLRTPADYWMRVTVGLFYQRQTDDIRSEFRIDDLPDSYAVDGSPKVLYLTQQTRVDRDYAVFTDLDVDLTSRLTLNAGIRKFWVDNTLYGFFGFGRWSDNPSGELSCNPAVSAATIVSNYRPCINTDKKAVEDGETHKVGLSYQIDREHLVYLKYATGFRPGGNNRRVGVAPYSPDTLVDLEMGWKTTWLSQHVRFNGALFFERWRDFQTGTVGTQGIGSVINGGNAAAKGVETEVGISAFGHVALEAAATYVTAVTLQNLCEIDPATEIVTHDCAQPVAAAGARLPIAPRLKGNVTAKYQFHWGNFENVLQASFLYQGSSNAYIAGAGPQLQQALRTFHTTDISVSTSHLNWRIGIYLQNVFDARGGLGSAVQCTAQYCFDNYRVYPTAPREFGIKFSQKF